MGVDISLNGGFPGATVSETTVTDAIWALREEGFVMSRDGRDDRLVEYTLKHREKDRSADQYRIEGQTKGPEEVLEAAEPGHLLRIPIYYDSSSSTLEFAFGSPIAYTDMTVQITGPDKWWFDAEKDGEAVVTDRCNAIVDLVETVAATVDPAVGYTTLHDDHSLGKDLVATTDPSGGQLDSGWNMGLETLPWITVLGPDWIDACGGREHVLATPGVDSTELETGHVLLRAAANPISMIGGLSGEPYDHLFGE